MRESHEAGREFFVRASGILIHDDSVLAQESDDGAGRLSYALPGGHVEFGESLAAATAREFYEETGLNVEAEKLVYVHENIYSAKGTETHEIGFYFAVDLNSAFPAPDPEGYIPSLESHIRMRLLPLAKLESSALMPPFLRTQLPRDVRDRFCHPPRHLVSNER